MQSTYTIFSFILVLLSITPRTNGIILRENLFPSFSDRRTVALWLFDDPQYMNVSLTDASENLYDLRLLRVR